MSGICAIWGTRQPGQAARTLAAVTRGLALQPSERTSFQMDGAGGLGVCSRFTTQQMASNSRILLACDADLLNAAELRHQVVESQEFTGGDTAALLGRLYLRFGLDFVAKLRGAFSFVLWDNAERQLIAAVDHFGMKRLVYHESPSNVLVASRIDALLHSGEIRREVRPEAIAKVLNFSANLAPETAVSQVRRLLPGTLLRVSSGHLDTKKYWDMQYGVGHETNEKRLSRELEDVVQASVRTHCDSARNTGAFLSGGTDSSTVVGMMSRTGTSRPHAFSIGFKEQSFNELEYAELAAKRFGAEHHTLLVGPDDCFAAMPNMVRYFDEPFGNSSAIPTYFCSKLAADSGMETLLAGDGGDELFGGNSWYATDKIFEKYHSLPPVLRKGLIEPALNLLPTEAGLIGKAKRYVRRSNMPGLDRVMSYHFLCSHGLDEVFEPDFLDSLKNYSVLEVPSRYYKDAPAKDHLDKLLYVDVKTILGDSDLPKVTTMSELAGIQVRFPFLDIAVAEFSGRIPASMKIKGFEKRYLFKQAFRNLLPEEIIKKKKHGFGIPVSTWLKTDRRMRELGRDTLLSQRAFERGYFKRQFIADLFEKHEEDDSSYYGDTLWTFLVLELWHRQFVDEPVGATR